MAVMARSTTVADLRILVVIVINLRSKLIIANWINIVKCYNLQKYVLGKNIPHLLWQRFSACTRLVVMNRLRLCAWYLIVVAAKGAGYKKL